MKFKLLCFTSLVIIFFLNEANANSQGFRDELPALQRLTDLSIGIKRIEKGLKYEFKGKTKKADKMYNEAIEFLLLANKNKNIDPNIFFYLGFAYNKLNNFTYSEIYYQVGLSMVPDHKMINKYLGKLYLNANKLDQAKEHLSVLKKCNCKEYDELKKIIDRK